MIGLPVKKTIWGDVNTVEDLRIHIAKNGQFFGEDKSGPACEFKTEYPCDQTFYQYMGFGLHKGLDIPCADSTEIYATHAGTVWKTSETISQGLGVVLESLDETYSTVYWHNKQNLVKVGDKVELGQVIALSDNTGYSKGNHLHFEYRIWKDNAYEAVDPMPYFVGKTMTEQEVRQLQALEGYKDEAGVEFWTGKNLSDYLKARLPDKVKTINETLV